MKKQKKQNLSELIVLIPLEKQDAAKMLLNEIIFLQKPLAEIKEQIEQEADTSSIKNYDTLCKRYSALIKQIIELMPRTTSRAETVDALTAFVESGKSL